MRIGLKKACVLAGDAHNAKWLLPLVLRRYADRSNG
jgi:hypothetical protein